VDIVARRRRVRERQPAYENLLKEFIRAEDVIHRARTEEEFEELFRAQGVVPPPRMPTFRVAEERVELETPRLTQLIHEELTYIVASRPRLFRLPEGLDTRVDELPLRSVDATRIVTERH